MSIHAIKARTIDGDQVGLDSFAGEALLVVNVASRCGFTPQYEAMQALHERYRDRGFSVLAFPCNQFGGQEPGSEDDIRAFCTSTYGVTFPLFAKIDVNGPEQHPLFARLAATPDADGEAGDVKWNFEKWVVAPDGEPVARFRTVVPPDGEAVVAAVERSLPARG